MDLEDRLQSLMKLVDSKTADYFMFDTSELGRYFLGGYQLNLDFFLSHPDSEKTHFSIRTALDNAQVCFEFLRNRKNTIAPPAVIGESQGKIIALKRFANQYELLDKLIKKEEQIIDLLTSRIEKVPSPNVLHSYKGFVIDAARQGDGNLVDETIVAEAMYKAFLNEQRIAIVTKDRRFKDILIKTQNSLALYGKECRDLLDFLQRGNLSIILGERYKGFYVDYNSREFNPSYMQVKPS